MALGCYKTWEPIHESALVLKAASKPFIQALNMLSLTRAVVLATGLLFCAQALDIELLADLDRDGRVTSADREVKKDATKSALLLANIGDTDTRCLRLFTSRLMSLGQYLRCNDADDDQLRNAKYLAPIEVSPCTECKKLPLGSFGRIFASHDAIRIFHKVSDSDTDGWKYVDSAYSISPAQLAEGLRLGIDSRDIRRPNWDGKAQVTIKVYSGLAGVAHDSISVQVAPVLTHHVLQEPYQVYTVAARRNDQPQQAFVDTVRQFSANIGKLQTPIHVFSPVVEISSAKKNGGELEIWAQDFFKPGYMSMPGPDPGTTISLRIMINSAQDKPAQRDRVFKELRKDDVGAVETFGDGGTLDSLGNLDTIPPFEHNGVKYPAGMPIIGTDGKTKPQISKFLESQGTPALEVDSDWLWVGHVDEFIQFLPDVRDPKNLKPRGWMLAVNDPNKGFELLKKARSRGHGAVKAFSRQRMPYDGRGGMGFEGFNDETIETMTIDELLNRPNLEAFNRFCASRTQSAIEKIMAMTGITSDRIIRVPVIYAGQLGTPSDAPLGHEPAAVDDSGYESGSESSSISAKTKTVKLAALDFTKITALGLRAKSVYPNAINGLVFSNGKYLAPQLWGPVIDGKDILEEAVDTVYRDAGFEPSFLDDWMSHHKYDGDVHCATNMARDASQPWW